MQDLMPPINTPDSAFHDGDPTTGQLGTIVTALWLNNVQAATRDVQLEIKNVLAKAGIQPDPKKTNQLAEAINQIIGSGNYASTAYVDNGLNKKIDKANISGVKGNDNDKVPSLNLFTTEIGKLASIGYSYSKIESDGRYQPKGNYAPAGDYATNTALTNGLNGKFDKTSVTQSSGSSTTQVMSQDAVTKALANKFNITGGDIAGRVDVTSVITASQVVARTPSNSTLQLNPIDAGPRIEHRAKNSTWYIHALQNATGTIMHLEDPGTIPIGGYILWASNASYPSHFWEAKDRAFSETEYPELAKIHPSLRIPDPRGYGIRIADNGRGVDVGRTVGTFQEDALQDIEGVMSTSSSYGIATDGNPTGAFYKTTESRNPYAGGGSGTAYNIGFSAKRVARTADETRMKNYSMILLIRVK
ncbi:hypothetical protein M0I35_RS04870 [Providencia rettgeri]|nr:hypothetical protein [Providencia rettgeri]